MGEGSDEHQGSAQSAVSRLYPRVFSHVGSLVRFDLGWKSARLVDVDCNWEEFAISSNGPNSAWCLRVPATYGGVFYSTNWGAAWTETLVNASQWQWVTCSDERSTAHGGGLGRFAPRVHQCGRDLDNQNPRRRRQPLLVVRYGLRRRLDRLRGVVSSRIRLVPLHKRRGELDRAERSGGKQLLFNCQFEGRTKPVAGRAESGLHLHERRHWLDRAFPRRPRYRLLGSRRVVRRREDPAGRFTSSMFSSSTMGYLYLSTNAGTSWAMINPASPLTGYRNWQCAAMSGDGQKMLVGEVGREVVHERQRRRGLERHRPHGYRRGLRLDRRRHFRRRKRVARRTVRRPRCT